MTSNVKKLTQILIEDKYSRKNIQNTIIEDLNNSMGEMSSYVEKGIDLINEYLNKRSKYYTSKSIRVLELANSKIEPEDILTDLLVLILPMTNPQPIQGVVGQLAVTLAYNDPLDAIKTAAELVGVVCHADLYDVIPARDSETGSLMVKSRFILEELTLQKLSNYKYLPPMVVPPMMVKLNSQSGYLTKDDSVILGKGNHHDKPQALDVINQANSVALSLDRGMLRFKEKAKKPLDTQEKLDNHRRLVNSSKVVYKELIEQGNKFYFNWKYDKRGRMYSQGYHVNIQSSTFKKTIINLHEKHLITK